MPIPMDFDEGSVFIYGGKREPEEILHFKEPLER